MTTEHDYAPLPVVSTSDERRRPRAAVVAVAWLRRRFWRLFLFFLGGVTVSGRLPRGGCVVVANHSSHADAAVLLAALRARHAPRFAAATDYWFRSRLRRFTCSVLVSAFPVRRHVGGYADLERVGIPLLRAGHAVVVFPEGTRDGGIAEFRRGAFTLAAAAGVPVVPVAVCGTAELLPKGGRLRPRAVGVRVGEPMAAPEPARARAAVVDLAAGYHWRDSRTRARLAQLAMSRWGLLLVAVWSAAEAVSWPLLPELLLAVLCVAAPWVGPRLIATAAAASVAGGVLTLVLYANADVSVPQPLTTSRMYATAGDQIRQDGASAVRFQPASGIPYKVYSAEAGRAGVPAGEWAVSSALARGQRVVIVGVFLTLVGLVAQRVRRFFVPYLVFLGTLFVGLLYLIVTMWS